jgi:hypothetical protein
MHMTCTGTTSSGELVYQRLLFVPIGAFEVTAFISTLLASLPDCNPKLWLSGYGDNVTVKSTWNDVIQPAFGALSPMGAGLTLSGLGGSGGSASKFEPISLLRLCSGKQHADAPEDGLRLSKSRVYGVPWFVGQRSEVSACMLLTDLCDEIVNNGVREFQVGATDPHTLITTMVATLATCVLMHHVDDALVCRGNRQLIHAVVSLVGDILRSHTQSSVMKIISLTVGYAGDKATEVLHTITTVCKQICGVLTPAPTPKRAPSFQYASSCGLPKLPGNLPLSMSSPATSSSSSPTSLYTGDAVVVLIRWAFVTIPALAAALDGPTSDPLSHLALEFVDAAVEMYKRHPVASKAVQLLTQQLAVSPTMVRGAIASLASVI